jgi:hypothetical protein
MKRRKAEENLKSREEETARRMAKERAAKIHAKKKYAPSSATEGATEKPRGCLILKRFKG